MEDFDPARSYGTVIVAVRDPDRLYEAFAAGLRQRYGKLPVAGIPRIGRPKRRYGTVRGFSVVDPGGNWLRISKSGDVEEDSSAPRPRLTALVPAGSAARTDAWNTLRSK